MKHAWVAGLLLLVGACTPTLPEIAEGAIDAPECGYEQARAAARAAQDDYSNAREPGPRASAEARADFEEKRRAADTAAQRKQDAEECEASAREWSDLRAQWANARAANNVARLSSNQIAWTVAEIIALVATIGVGVFAIWDGHNHAMQQLRAYLSVQEPSVGAAHNNVVLKAKNVGQTPARGVCVTIGWDIKTSPYEPVTVFPNKPRAFGDRGPGSDAELTLAMEPTEVTKRLGAISGTKKYLVVQGRVDYRDAFRRRRVTHFRFFKEAATDSLTDGKLTIASEGNSIE